MKRIDIFCASQASTAIMDDQPSSSSSAAAAVQLGGRAIDRHNPIIRDLRRAPRVLPNPPCTSQLPPITPLPYHLLDKTKTKTKTNNKKPNKSKEINPIPKTKKKKQSISDAQTLQKGKKISSSPSDYDYYSPSSVINVARDVATRSWSATGLNLVTPPGSSRYLLSDSILFDGFSDLDPGPQPDTTEPEKVAALDTIPADDANPVPVSPPKPPPPPSNQIVELRVSLHCKGCEGKVRKHLSKMEGNRKHMPFSSSSFFCHV
ncbi:Protein SODIUM POTASSIUM ROOT DEFECTIVE 3 [Linum grandiflorum]